MTQQQAKAFFEPYIDTIRLAFEEAESHYKAQIAALVPVAKMNMRFRANLRNVLILGAVGRAFEGDPRYRDVEISTGVYAMLGENDSAVIFKVKKFDRNGLSSNIETDTVKAYRDRNTTLDFPGIPHQLPRLEVGYILDDAGQIARLTIVCRQKNTVEWTIDFHEDAANVVQLPLRPKQSEPSRSVKVKAKDEAKRQRGIRKKNESNGGDA